jgi:hypothetical protein
VTFNSGGDITSASAAFNDASTLTITLSILTAGSTDFFTVGQTGLQIRPTAAAPVATARHLYRPTTSGGTLSINGVITSTDGSSGTSFGELSEIYGAFTKLLALLPGENYSPGSANGKSSLPTAQTAGVSFAVRVAGVDNNWNIVSNLTGTAYSMHLVTSDANATPPTDVNLANGTAQFNVTLPTAGSSSVTVTDADDGTKTPAASPAFAVSPGPFARLQALAPGESAAPGTASGQTGSPTSQSVNSSLSVTVRAVDAFFNLITTNDTVHITASDPYATLPANAALSGGSATFQITFFGAGSRTITAANVTHSGITSDTTSAINVIGGPFSRLLVVVPGETAAPGSPNGKTGSPSAQTAGTSFSATVLAVDNFWNLVNTVSDTIHVLSSDATAILPGSGPLAGGTSSLSVTYRSAGMQSITVSDVTDGTKTGAAGLSTAVNPAPASRLQIAQQPSATATAGTSFGTQPKILISDTYGNIRSNDTLSVVASINSGLGQLIGTTTVSANSGLASFSNLAATAATNIVLQFSSGALTPALSSAIAVSVGPFTRLLGLMPGESLSPGTSTGKTGTPTAVAGTSTSLRIFAADSWFNLTPGSPDTVRVTSSDVNATLPPDAPLAGGSNTVNITLKTAGTRSVIVTDLTDGTKSSNTNSLTISPGSYSKLQLLVPGEAPNPGTVGGKTGTPNVEIASVPFQVTVNGVDSLWNVTTAANGSGSTIRLTSTDPSAVLPANATLANGTRQFSVTLRTVGTATITASNIDDITKSASISPSLVITTAPFSQMLVLLPGETFAPGTATGKSGTPTTQVAGVPFNVTIRSVDSVYNSVSTNDVVHFVSSDAFAVLPSDAALINGLGTFNVTLKDAGSQTVNASDVTHPGITAGLSSAITVNPNSWATLQVLLPGETSVPGSVSGKTGTPTSQNAGAAFNLTVNAVDTYWNVVATNASIHLTCTDANATVPADTTLGTSGSKTDNSLTFKTVGNYTVTAVATADVSKTNTSSVVSVVPGSFAKLQLLLPGETAVPGTASGKTGTPQIQYSNTAFTVSVSGVDANWNLIATNDTIHLVSNDPNAILPPNAALSGGKQNFNVTLRTLGTNLTVTASDATRAGISTSVSSLITVQPPSGLRGGPVVGIHDSEYTRALETMAAIAPTPSGAGTTGKQWWSTNWHYFVMPESLKEALRSDGTVFEVLTDADIAAGRLLNTNGTPKYPIFISLAAEAVDDGEIAQLTNYVAAGGFMIVGSSSFTRQTNGAPRGDFAIGNAMGIHSTSTNLNNWSPSQQVLKLANHRLISHVPDGVLLWEMPSTSEESPWGIYPHPNNPMPTNSLWQIVNSSANSLMVGDSTALLLDKTYGSGHFIYYGAMQPLVGHGGFSPGMYTYMIFRHAIEWAFESWHQPIPRLSPWPYQQDAAMMSRHDLENFQNEIAGVEASAQIEFTNGVKGEYYFCTGTLRENMFPTYNTNAVVAGLQRAMSNYNAVVSTHNGGLRNPYNAPALGTNDYDYWHWGPDEALGTNPPGYASGKAYAFASVSNSFIDIENWLPGQMTNGMRVWVAPYFDATREDSFDIQSQLNVKASGDQKLSVFPSWVLSTVTPGKRYSFVSLPTSDWFVGNTLSQSMEAGHTVASIHDGVDFYYALGGLLNFYSHTLTTGVGPSGGLPAEYVTYAANTNLHPRLWKVNAIDLYQWWNKRSTAKVTASYIATNGDQASLFFNITSSSDPTMAVETYFPASGSISNLQVFTNKTLAGSSVYRTNGQNLKVLVGTQVTNTEIRYLLAPRAMQDTYAFVPTPAFVVPAPGVLNNDFKGASLQTITAILVTQPTNGTVTLNTNGAFTYVPGGTFNGLDSFTYKVNDGYADSPPVLVSLSTIVAPSFSDDFVRGTDPGPIAPWILRAGNWTVTSGELRGGTNTLSTYGNVYLTNVWTDYAAELKIRFPAGGYGAGLGSRLNATSGAHYAAWLYPEGSPAGGPLLRLIKFSDWSTWSLMQQINLNPLGTGLHTLRMAVMGNHITVYLDGFQLINVPDNSSQQLLTGGISVDMWTDVVPYVLGVDNVLVTSLVRDDSYTVNQNATLNVSAPGILTNDTAVFTSTLTSSLISGVSHGTLNLGTNGDFTYTPTTGYFGSDQFIYQANDGQNSLGTATVTINVTSLNPAPVIQSIRFATNTATLTWSSIVGRSYRMQFKNSVTNAAWTDITPDIVASGTTTIANSASTNGQRFYRVILLP